MALRIEDMRIAGVFAIAHNHPALPGHFPGQPVVPGVVVMDHAVALVQPAILGRSVSCVRNAKFFSPVLPGQDIEVRFQDQPGSTCAIICLRGTETIMSCMLATAAHPGGA